VQGFGFPLALHILTDIATNIDLYAHLYIERFTIKAERAS